MEYAMMVSMGAVQEDTPVVTIVHDCQVSSDVPMSPLQQGGSSGTLPALSGEDTWNDAGLASLFPLSLMGLHVTRHQEWGTVLGNLVLAA